jgi:hypothetical protein
MTDYDNDDFAEKYEPEEQETRTPAPIGTRRRPPQQEYEDEQYDAPLPRRGYGCADVITALFILATIFVISITVLLLSNPHTPFNPLPPPTAVELIVYVTETPLPTLTPSMTYTPEPPTPTQPTPTPTLTPTETLTLTPTVTNTPVFGGEGTPTPLVPAIEPSLQFTRSPFAFTASIAYQGNTTNEGCDWASIAGATFDLQGKPLPGLALRITSEDSSVDEVQYSGKEKRYGDSGFEVYLGDKPQAENFTVQLLGRTGQPISDLLTITTHDTCTENVVFITFQQNHSY